MSFIGDILGTNVKKESPIAVQNPYDAGLIAQQQQQFVNALQSQANGTGGPSAAQQLMQNAMDQNAANSYSMAASQRGTNPMLAMRNAAQANAQAGLQSAGQTAAMRAQEQLNAQQMLGSQLHNMSSAGASYANMNLQGQMNNANNNGKTGGGILGAIGSVGGKLLGMADGGEVPDSGSGGGAGKGSFSTFADEYKKAWAQPNFTPDTHFIPFKSGGQVPGVASVPGDSQTNDTVPAMLSPGEIVIPRSRASDPEMAKEFIDHIMSRKKAKEPGQGYSKVLEAHRAMTAAIKHMEKHGG